MKKRNFILFGLVLIILFAIGAFLLIVIRYVNSPNISEVVSEPISKPNILSYPVSSPQIRIWNEDNRTPDLSQFSQKNLEHITLNLPSNWSTRELVLDDPITKQGRYIISGTPTIHPTDSGFIGFVVFNERQEVVFIVGAQTGVGIVNAGFDVYRFPDTNPEYVNQTVEESISFLKHVEGVVVEKEISENYIEFNLFGTRFRRIDDELYVDITKDDNFFDPGLGAFFAFVSLPNISYRLSSTIGELGDRMSLYFYKMETNNIHSEYEYKLLDEVLKSVRKI